MADTQTSTLQAHRFRLLVTTLVGIAAFFVGCGESEQDALPTKADSSTETERDEMPPPAIEAEPVAFELDVDSLLAAQLAADELAEGWVRLFDGQSLEGLFVAGIADWNVADGVISVTGGERSYLCSSFKLADFEFKVDFRAEPNTNSGIFLRTRAIPENVETDSIELNIAPPDNPFPTGSLVQRKKLEPVDLGAFDPTTWHTYHVRLQGKSISVKLDGKEILTADDLETAETGHISLQHNSGKIEFKNLLLKPLQREAINLAADWEQSWDKSTKADAKLQVDVTEDGLRLSGGLGQLQSKVDLANFILQAEYTLAKPEVNSGIFFRCIRDNMLDGYECQVNHATIDNNPTMPADAGAGAIFRRQPARVVVGDGTKRTYLTLMALGPQIITWVNGIQVAEFVDTRAADPNPRKGLRLEAGPIALQAHDPATDVTFHKINVTLVDEQ